MLLNSLLSVKLLSNLSQENLTQELHRTIIFSIRFINRNAVFMNRLTNSLDRINTISRFAHLVTSGTCLASLTCSAKLNFEHTFHI